MLSVIALIITVGIEYYKNGVWSKAKKLPEPINSYAIGWGGKVTRDGKYFLWQQPQ
jgi:hypothetical protein